MQYLIAVTRTAEGLFDKARWPPSRTLARTFAQPMLCSAMRRFILILVEEWNRRLRKEKEGRERRADWWKTEGA